MSKFQAYGENTWEFAAWKAIREHDLDVPTNRKENLPDLYDADKFDAVANKAWNLIRDAGVEWSVEDMITLMAQKQHDYGHKNVEKFGAAGVKVRLWDKISRYQNLVAKGVDPIAANFTKGKSTKAPAADSLTDTLIDMIGYVTILFMVQRGTFANQLAETPEDRGEA